MALIQTPPPFNETPGEIPIPWTRWRKMFENYLVASGGETFQPRRKMALLLHCLGTEGQRIYFSLPEPITIKQEDISEVNNCYTQAMERVEKHYLVPENKLTARIKFKNRMMLPGETVDNYLLALRQLISQCSYPSVVEEELIRDQLAQFCTVPKFQDRIVSESDQSLKNLTAIAKQLEQSSSDIKLLKAELKTSADCTAAADVASSSSQDGVHYIKGKSKNMLPENRFHKTPDSKKFYKKSKPSSHKYKNKKTCYRCGSMDHLANSELCKARFSICRKCNVKGHWESQCFSGTTGPLGSKRRGKVRQIHEENSESDSDYEEQPLHVLNVLNSGPGLSVHCQIRVNHIPLNLLVDTGSPRTLLSEEEYNKNFKHCELMNPKCTLKSYSKTEIQMLGCFNAEVRHDKNVCEIPIHVVKQGISLIGMDLIHSLGLKIDCESLQVNSTESSYIKLPSHIKQFEDLFSPEPGCAVGFTHKVQVKDNAIPVQAKLRRLPFSIRKTVSEELVKLEKNKIIERVDSSEWVSPMVVAWKKSGKIRLCIDLREVNKAIIPDRFPLPSIEELLAELRGAKYFARLDLAAAYHQLPLHEQSRNLTTFITHQGLFRYTRVCFGLASAPSAFQKMMSVILCQLKGVQCYLDDVIVYGKTRKEYEDNLKEVLTKIRKAGLKLNDKCEFDLESTEFLGHLITSEGIQPMPSRVQAIIDAPTPHDKTTLRAFLGLVGYYSKFCLDFATLVEPMRALIRGDQTFKWTDKAQESFLKVKQAIANNITLEFFDPDCETIVTTDASGYGVSGVLSQIKNNKEYIVACASRTLTEHERKYSVGEREALACVWACERCFTYLWGRHFHLRTDHSALTTLLSSHGTGRQPMRIARWNARLLIFDYSVIYRPGTSIELKVADCLSRLPLTDSLSSDIEDEVVLFLVAQVNDTSITLPELQVAKVEDAELCRVIGYIQNGWPRKSRIEKDLIVYYAVRDELTVVKGVVMRSDRIIPPTNVTMKSVQIAHQGHQGMTRTKQRLRELYWWKSMDLQVEKMIQSCVVCQQSDKAARTYEAPMKPIDLPDEPWQTLAIDIIGPMDQLPNDYRYAVTLIDLYSKWPEVAFSSRITSETVIKFLDTVFSREGLPEQINSDNGSQFVSTMMENYFRKNNITHKLSAVAHPETNGQIERFHRGLKDAIQISKLEKKPVKQALTTYLALYRNTPQATTGKTPSLLLHKRNMRSTLSVKGIHRFESQIVDQKNLKLRVKEKQFKSKNYTDNKRSAKWSKLKVGDYVRVKIPKVMRKGDKKFTEPVKIVKQKGPGTFQTQDHKTWNQKQLLFILW